jgi:hypothetical protein
MAAVMQAGFDPGIIAMYIFGQFTAITLLIR